MKRKRRSPVLVGRSLGKLPPDLNAARKRLRRATAKFAEWTLRAAERGVVPDLDSDEWTGLGLEIERAFEAGDAERAMAAVRAWEAHAREVLEVNEPLKGT